MGTICRGIPLPSPVARTLAFSATSRRALHLRSKYAYFRPWSIPLARNIWWTPKHHPKVLEVHDLSGTQEDIAKAAILDKVMKGRQPTDLMLRCE